MFIIERILIIGGDERQLTVADEFKNDGYITDVYCIGSYDTMLSFNYDTQYDIIVCGLPFSRDGRHINAPLSEIKPEITDIKKIIKKDGILFGGSVSSDIISVFEDSGIRFIDYYNEELALKNAILTAEGAFSLAVSESPFALYGAKCLIAGYGRIGKYLSRLLSPTGAEISVSARKPADIAMISAYGHTAVLTSEINRGIEKYDFIFNTIPSRIISDESAGYFGKNQTYIELASSPGGLNPEILIKNNIRFIPASSLPGRFSPVTAGKIIKNTIVNIMEKEVG